jgi:glycosyltransferase involved in cell wall biosynthesis
MIDVTHVGRSGEVAGGMSQVVNGYLNWPFERTRLAFIATRDGSRGLRALMTFLRGVARLSRLSRSGVVVVHLSQRGSFVREGIAVRLAAARNIPTVAHLHGSEFADFARSHGRLVRSVLRRCKLILSLSAETAVAAQGLAAGVPVVVIPNAVPPGRTDRQREPRVVFGGAVSRRKGVDILLAAWRALAAEDRQGWTLSLAGPLVDEDLVVDLPDGAETLGAIAHADLMELLERSQIAVLPSRHEALPMFLIEAMARSNYVIATDVGGVSQLFERPVGVLLPPESQTALEGALRSALTDRDLRRRGAEEARKRFDDAYSASAVYPLVEDAWLSAAGIGPKK